MRATILCVAAFMLVPSGALAAQAAQLKTGDRIRITDPGYGIDDQVASVLSIGKDSLFLRVARVDSIGIPMAGITALDVSTGRTRDTWRFAGIGALTGAAAGVLIGAVGHSDDPDDLIETSRTDDAIGLGILFGGAGLLIGAVAGASHVSDRWQPVAIGVGRATPSLEVDGRGARLALSVAF